jgi:multisubunit Na+/H+ antiporter MnhG subunit
MKIFRVLFITALYIFMVVMMAINTGRQMTFVLLLTLSAPFALMLLARLLGNKGRRRSSDDEGYGYRYSYKYGSKYPK